VGKGRVVKVSGITHQGRTATVLLRGSNKLVLEEAERSFHDALCVIRCLVQKRFLITGGASPEVEVTHQLSKWSKTLQVTPGWDQAVASGSVIAG
jgi:T-complex protein 1 subunit delta